MVPRSVLITLPLFDLLSRHLFDCTILFELALFVVKHLKLFDLSHKFWMRYIRKFGAKQIPKPLFGPTKHILGISNLDIRDLLEMLKRARLNAVSSLNGARQAFRK
jgi:hypothetical protein